MTKLRLILSFTALVSLLAISAAPPALSFSPSKGTGTLTLKTTALFSINSGSLIVECPLLEKGVWEQTSATKEVFRGQLTKCTSTVAGLKKLATVNSTCELLAEQAKPEALSGTGGIASGCTITRGTCIITVPAGKPNVGLKVVTFVTVETKNDEVVSNVAGITYTVNAGCEALEIKGGSDGTFKGSVLAAGQTP